jgi:hypothetical protein
MAARDIQGLGAKPVFFTLHPSSAPFSAVWGILSAKPSKKSGMFK